MLLASYLHDSESNGSAAVKQYTTYASSPGRRLLFDDSAPSPGQSPAPGPGPSPSLCTAASEMTMYLVFPVDTADLLWNTVRTFLCCNLWDMCIVLVGRTWGDGYSQVCCRRQEGPWSHIFNLSVFSFSVTRKKILQELSR